MANDRKSILVVEDDEMFRHVLRNHLAAHGYEVREAENGLVARTILQLAKFDVVISDVQMPQLDGLQLLEYVKKSSGSRFILMTGFSGIVDAAQAKELGADVFLPKPFRREDLLLAVREISNHTVVEPPSQKILESDYCRVEIVDFITGTELPADIFLKLADNHFIKLANRGQAVPVDRITIYREKGIHHLYLRKDDFARYVGFNMKLFQAARTAPQIEVDRKMNLLRHVTDTLMDQLFTDGLQRERLQEASQMVIGAVDLLARSDETLQLFDLVMNAGKMSEHAICVSMLSAMICKESGWVAPSTLFKVTLAGLFHDIGYKELPPELIGKKRLQMSSDERQIFEGHTLRGRAILTSVAGLPEGVAVAAAQHHENLVGSGYPNRLRGDQIHPISRIVSVADQFCDLMLAHAGNEHFKAHHAIENLHEDHPREFDRRFLDALARLLKKEKIGRTGTDAQTGRRN